MAFQEILEGITRHRSNPVTIDADRPPEVDIKRKIEEIEWALQAIVETLVELQSTAPQRKETKPEAMYEEPVRKKKHK